VAAKSIFETSERAGLNQQNRQLQEIQSPGAGNGSVLDESNPDAKQEDESWRAKFLLKSQVCVCAREVVDSVLK
jgi:hypothetical protein